MGRKIVNVKPNLKSETPSLDKKPVTDMVKHITNAKWKWAWHIVRIKINPWTIRIRKFQKTNRVTPV